jgi:hypothetical protein
MKKQVILFLIFFFCSLLCPFGTQASLAVSKQEMRLHLMEKIRHQPGQAVKNDARTSKRLHRIGQRLARRAAIRSASQIDFDDPVDKWLWYGLFGLGIAVVLSIFTPFGLVGLVAFLAIVCLVIWVIKRGAV